LVTLGAFDGVHLGHQKLLTYLKHKAEQLNTESVVISLWPHPRIVLNKDLQSFSLLNSLDEKKLLLEKAGIKNLVIIPFDQAISRMGAEEFVKQVIIEKLDTALFLLGFNNMIGHKQEGNFEFLTKLSAKYNFMLEQFHPELLDGNKISSTLVRNELLAGRVENANKLLGYQYSISGLVAEGKKMGRLIGFPTANIVPLDQYKLVPLQGVYAAYTSTEQGVFPSMLNIGYRPTIGNNLEKTVEVHLFNFDDSLYNKELTISFVSRLRDEKKFAGLEDLKRQLIEDKNISIQVLNKNKYHYL